ncbi:uncharacterized protein LOC116739089 [Phocoena sinus]|nr:uncharacterized protein LOC116739089 [Phocoena sinus]
MWAPQPAMCTRKSSGRWLPFGAPLRCPKSPEVVCKRFPATNPREGSGSWLGAGRTFGAASGPRALTEPKGLRARESWGYEAIVHPLPQTATRQALCPRERKVTSSGRRQHRGKGDGKGQGSPRTPGKWGYWTLQGAPFGLLRSGASPAPAAQRVAERSGREPRRRAWPLCPGRPGDAAARGLDTEVHLLGKSWRPLPGSPTWSPGLQAPRVRAGSSHSCKEGAKYVFQTFHGSKLSASIKKSGVRGKSILGISMQMNGPGFQLRSGFPPPRAQLAQSHACPRVPGVAPREDQSSNSTPVLSG